jgi:hypothetical protein
MLVKARMLLHCAFLFGRTRVMTAPRQGIIQASQGAKGNMINPLLRGKTGDSELPYVVDL